MHSVEQIIPKKTKELLIKIIRSHLGDAIKAIRRVNNRRTTSLPLLKLEPGSCQILLLNYCQTL